MTSDPRRRAAVLMVWNETSGAYEAAAGTACVARWKSAGGNHAASDLCGRPMFRRAGDFTLCRHHWERMWGDGFSAFAEEEISELRARWDEERQRSESMRHAGQRAERAERRRTAGHIYYVRRVSDGLIKIGTTQSLKQRLGTLRSQYGEMEGPPEATPGGGQHHRPGSPQGWLSDGGPAAEVRPA